jgi:cell division protein FtsZ
MLGRANPEENMTINLSVPRTDNDLRPRITVVGVGGAGGNAVNNMIRSNLEGVDFVVTNTDAQSLAQSAAERKIQLGVGITRGLGAGARPEVGRDAAEEALEEIIDHVQGSNMVFITAGMGGGTGTGAAPVIARAAREHGILTVGVVTKPFHFEGTHRMRIADQGIEELTQYVDTLIIIPNQNLFRIATERTTFAEAFKLADDVLYSGVRGVTDLMIMPGLINLDFADIRTVMTEMGKAMMGTGEAEGEKRAIAAAEAAISNPLLDDVSMKGAKGVLINITGGPDMTLYEVDEAANRIREEVDSDANIIFGATLDTSLDGRVRISMVATGIEAMAATMPRPLSLVGGTKAMPRHEPRPAIAAAAPPRMMPATAGNNALAMSAQYAQPSTAELAAPLAAAPAPAPMPMAPMPAAAAAPLAAPLAAPAPAPMSLADEMADDLPDLMADLPPPAPVAPAPQPRATRPMPAGLPQGMPTPAAIAAATAERRPVGTRMTQPAARPADAPFIAPAPVEPTESAPSPTTRREPAADPFAEAALTNGGRAPAARDSGKDKPSGLDLFKRVTGLASLRRQATAPAASPAQAKTEPSLREGPRATAAQTAPMAGLSPSDRHQTSRQDDDLLDIPSFLRRQAN